MATCLLIQYVSNIQFVKLDKGSIIRTYVKIAHLVVLNVSLFNNAFDVRLATIWHHQVVHNVEEAALIVQAMEIAYRVLQIKRCLQVFAYARQEHIYKLTHVSHAQIIV